ncbi:MAG TPA: hypothetical protein VI818_01365 [Candidatus Thermoplasmatota archaeon]|nr:hypothetical protein [Candidatus Thermoplasmatota archaeon]
MGRVFLVGSVFGVVASVACAGAGFWLLNETEWGRDSEGVVWSALGVYFLGKAFFVGPMLAITAWAAEQKALPAMVADRAPAPQGFQVPARALPPNR